MDTFKELENVVFPSEEKTISVRDDDTYGGAHEYFVTPCWGFSDGKTKYAGPKIEISFVKKLDDGSMLPGLQSEQLVYILIDRQKKLNARFPSPQNEKALEGLEMFIEAQRERVEDRLSRGVMGDLKK